MITYMQISSMHKVFLDEDYNKLSEVSGITALKGERVSYQILYTGGPWKKAVKFEAKKDDRINLKVRIVGNVPSQHPVKRYDADDYYLRYTPGLYPDVLYPLEGEWFESVDGNCHALFITAELPNDIEAGTYPIEVSLTSEFGTEKKVFEINVLDLALPEPELTYTQWFHTDCIASYYNYEVFSEEHWAMTEKFIEAAAYSGINLILTPFFTPPLDTEVGRERPTVQLTDITYKNGEYTFGFEKAKRWIEMCRRHGIEKFEVPHLFTQWGTGCTPKIEAETENGMEKIFGWDVKAEDEKYKNFLKNFLPALTEFLKGEGVYENTYFHVSDEPNLETHFECYKAEREMLNEYIPAEKIMDAISHWEFCEAGLVTRPVAITCSVDAFFEKGYKDIWTYYCCGPAGGGFSNRFMAMPSGRNRILGTQLYKYNIKGFLHWGFNFYYSQLSKRKINPFMVTDADEAFQSGDAFTVYPGDNGPLESLRGVVFYEGIQDLAACRLLETYIGREEVVKIIEESGTISFNNYPRTDWGVAEIRNRINRKLAEVIK